MPGLLVALVLNSFAGHGIRLVDAEDLDQVGRPRLTEKQLINQQLDIEADRPSLPSIIVPLSFGGILGTAGLGGLVFGIALLANAGSSVYAGLAVVIGLIFTGAGAVLLAGAIVCIVFGVKNLRARGAASDELERLRSTPAAPPVVEPPVEAPVPPQVRFGPQHLITVAVF